MTVYIWDRARSCFTGHKFSNCCVIWSYFVDVVGCFFRRKSVVTRRWVMEFSWKADYLRQTRAMEDRDNCFR